MLEGAAPAVVLEAAVLAVVLEAAVPPVDFQDCSTLLRRKRISSIVIFVCISISATLLLCIVAL